MVKVDGHEVPEGLYYTKEFEWLKIEGDKVRVGITDYAQGNRLCGAAKSWNDYKAERPLWHSGICQSRIRPSGANKRNDRTSECGSPVET
jgi:hypothetical protein